MTLAAHSRFPRRPLRVLKHLGVVSLKYQLAGIVLFGTVSGTLYSLQYRLSSLVFASFAVMYSVWLALLFATLSGPDPKHTDCKIRLPICIAECSCPALSAVSVASSSCAGTLAAMNVPAAVSVISVSLCIIYCLSPVLVQINWLPNVVDASDKALEEEVSRAKKESRAHLSSIAAVRGLAEHDCSVSSLRMPNSWSMIHDPVCLNAVLLFGTACDVQELERRILLSQPVRPSKQSTYDFLTTGLALALAFHGDDTLSEQATDKIAFDLIPQAQAPASAAALGVYVPGTLGACFNTENHHVNHTISTLIRNDFVFRRESSKRGAGDSSFNNATNGCEKHVRALLMGIVTERSTFEYSSVPYEGYTVQALLVLCAAARTECLRMLASRAIDVLLERVCASTIGDGKQLAPCRRNVNKHSLTWLHDHRLTALLQLFSGVEITGAGNHHKFGAITALIGGELAYAPPESVMQWFREPDRRCSYEMTCTHRLGSSQHFSGNRLHVLSSGGCATPFGSRVLLRPTTLLLRNGASDLRECFRLLGRSGQYGSFASGGPYGWYGQLGGWDLSGVASGFAIAKDAKALAPGDQSVVCSSAEGDWEVYLPRTASEHIGVGMFNSEEHVAAIVIDEGVQTQRACKRFLAHLEGQRKALIRGYGTFVHQDNSFVHFVLSKRGYVISKKSSALQLSLLNT